MVIDPPVLVYKGFSTKTSTALKALSGTAKGLQEVGVLHAAHTYRLLRS